MLKLECDLPRGVQLRIGVIAGQDHGHRRWMDRLHHGVRVGGQDAEQQVVAFLSANEAAFQTLLWIA